MKKRTAALLTLLLTCGAMAVPVSAAENQQNSTPQKSQVTVTTSIDPTYTVTIPRTPELPLTPYRRSSAQ